MVWVGVTGGQGFVDVDAQTRQVVHVNHTIAHVRADGVHAVLNRMALGIAGVTTMFSVVNGVMLRGFSFPNADRLMNVRFIDPTSASFFERGAVPSLVLLAVSAIPLALLTIRGQNEP